MAEQLAHNKSIYVAGIFTDTTALKELDTSSLPQHIRAYLEADNTGEYYLELSSSQPESLPDIVAPSTGGGRWIKKTSAQVADYSLVRQLASIDQFSHQQNTDQYLDFGGSNQVSVSDLHALLASSFKQGVNEQTEDLIFDLGTHNFQIHQTFGDDPIFKVSVDGTITIPEVVKIGVYGTISETIGGLSCITGNSAAANRTADNQVIKTSGDPGIWTRMRYDQGFSIHTGFTGSAGTTAADDDFMRMIIDNSGVTSFYNDVQILDMTKGIVLKDDADNSLVRARISGGKWVFEAI